MKKSKNLEIDLTDRLVAIWYSAKRNTPDSERDVIAYLSKPVYVEAKKRFERMDSMDVVFYGAGIWYLNGKGIDRKHIHRWTEIPEGWLD